MYPCSHTGPHLNIAYNLTQQILLTVCTALTLCLYICYALHMQAPCLAVGVKVNQLCHLLDHLYISPRNPLIFVSFTQSDLHWIYVAQC